MEILDNHYEYLKSNRDLVLQDLINKINNSEQFIFVRFGDGECRNIFSQDESEHNDDGNYYYKEQGIQLLDAYKWFVKNTNTYLGKWHSHIYPILEQFPIECTLVYYDLLTHKVENHKIPQLKIDFFKSIKQSNRKKIYCSNKEIINVLTDVLHLDTTIEIPLQNSFKNLSSIVHQLLNLEPDNAIIMFSGGMTAKIIIKYIAEKFPNNTYIDCGSIFDPMVGRFSRDFNTFEQIKLLLTNY